MRATYRPFQIIIFKINYSVYGKRCSHDFLVEWKMEIPLHCSTLFYLFHFPWSLAKPQNEYVCRCPPGDGNARNESFEGELEFSVNIYYLKQYHVTGSCEKTGLKIRLSSKHSISPYIEEDISQRGPDMEDERKLCYSVLQSVILLTNVHVEGTRDPRKGGKQNLISLSQQLLRVKLCGRPDRTVVTAVLSAWQPCFSYFLKSAPDRPDLWHTTLLFEISAFFTVIPHSSFKALTVTASKFCTVKFPQLPQQVLFYWIISSCVWANPRNGIFKHLKASSAWSWRRLCWYHSALSFVHDSKP